MAGEGLAQRCGQVLRLGMEHADHIEQQFVDVPVFVIVWKLYEIRCGHRELSLTRATRRVSVVVPHPNCSGSDSEQRQCPAAATGIGEQGQRSGVQSAKWPHRLEGMGMNDAEVTMSNAATNINLVAHLKALEAAGIAIKLDQVRAMTWPL